jgi:Tol biopolymer transport system component
VRSLLLIFAALVSVSAVAADAGGRPARAPSLTFKQVTLDGKRRVLSRHTFDPYVVSLSPDHRELAYIAQPAVGVRDNPVLVADVRTARERVLADTGCQSSGVSWAPNGQVLALIASAGAFCTEGGLWFVNPDGSGFHRVDRAPGLVWSPDSKSLAGSRPVSILSLATGEERVLSAGHSPAWSPDGSRIAFVHNTPSDLQVLGVASVRTGAVQDYTRANSSSPVWSPDGSRIAFIRFVRDAYHLELWVTSSRKRNPRRLARGLAPTTPFVWSPKGRQIAYVRGATLFARRLDGRVGRFLAYENGAAITPLAWSRDGRRVLYFTLAR